MTQLFAQADIPVLNADNSSDDVQEIGYTPKKSTQSEYYNQKPNEASRQSASVTGGENIMNQTPKTPQNQRNIDNGKRSDNMQMKTPDSANRMQDGIKTSNYPSNDDKSDIGATNQFLYLLFPNQAQTAINHPYNVNGLLAANNVGIFPQNFGAFSQLIGQDPTNMIFAANPAAFFGNGASSLGYIGNPAMLHGAGINISAMEEQRKQQLIQNTQQTAAAQQMKSTTAQKAQAQSQENLATNSINAKNVEVNYPANSITDEQVDTETNSISKSVQKGAQVADNKRRKARQCFNQYCQTDPENPNLWSKTRVTGKMSCKVCEEAWKNQQYCYFCKQIYLEEGEAFNDPKPWIGCDSCERWTHTECEDKALQKRIKWHQDRGEDFEYKCPNCRPKTKTPGRGGKPKRGAVTPQLNENSRGFEHQTYEEFEEDPLRKQVKMSAVESPEAKCDEFNQNSNSNVIVPEENCIAKKKLENMFNKHMQKRRLQFGKPHAHVDFYAVIENMLSHHGKKLQLSEAEVQHDLMLMRDANKNSSSEYSSPMDEEFTEHQNLAYIEEERKAGGRTKARGGRANNSRRGNAAEKAFHDMQDDAPQKEDFDEYLPTGQSKRHTRGKR